jgi:hypothetical protein
MQVLAFTAPLKESPLGIQGNTLLKARVLT